MNNTRTIISLLLSDKGFIKTICFQKRKYIGDPINTLRLLNDQEAEEIIIFDIDKRYSKKNIDFEYLKKITSECFSPMSYGGGINNLNDASNILKCGFEKIVFCENVFINPRLIKSSINEAGSQSIVACIEYFSENQKLNIKNNFDEKFKKFTLNDICKYCEDLGVGEIILHSIDKDGTFSGLDFNIYDKLSKEIKIPLILSGGCNGLEDIRLAKKKNLIGFAASSTFIYTGNLNAVLINYHKKNNI